MSESTLNLFSKFLKGKEVNKIDIFKRVSSLYSINSEHQKRLEYYLKKEWFMPASPILYSDKNSLPISCFLLSLEDNIHERINNLQSILIHSSLGGGLGVLLDRISEPGALNSNGKIPSGGIIPNIKLLEHFNGIINQAGARKAATAVYLNVYHSEIEEFIKVRKITGETDITRRAPWIHHGVVLDDNFMDAVKNGLDIQLKSPSNNSEVNKSIKCVSARKIWQNILQTRVETGEPFIVFKDNVMRGRSNIMKKLSLQVDQSNLCTEILLPTSKDHLGITRTGVCCLSSLNLEKFDEFYLNNEFIHDIFLFLDKVLDYFIKSGKDNAVYSAYRERSVGLGVMGYDSYLKSKMIAFEDSEEINEKIFSFLKKSSDKASIEIAKKISPCPDAKDAGINERFSNKIAIAPTSTIANLLEVSQSIEPIISNSYILRDDNGTRVIKNKFLKKILSEKNIDNQDTWTQIIKDNGSVKSIDQLSNHEKNVFKTAFEIDQEKLVDLAIKRQKYICQGQSLNLFIKADENVKKIHDIHMKASKSLKTLYYVRSRPLFRAQDCLSCS